MTTNQNVTLKVDSHCFKLHRSYSISFNLSNVGDIFGVIFVSKFRKEKENCYVVLIYSIKRAPEIRNFHVTVVRQRLRNEQKSVIHVKSCFLFCQSKPIVFGCSPSPLQKLPIAVIQKFCYHGNVTSHFSLSSREFAFCLHMISVHICPCTGRTFEETVLWGAIRCSEVE